jgi:hypothetical protein
MPDEPTSNAEPIDVHAVIAIMIDQLSAIAWAKLGLQPDMITNKIEKDLNQAKLAIDVATDLARHTEPTLDEEDSRRMQNLLRDLRLNYLQKRKETEGGE